MSTKIRALLLSCTTILMCISMIAVGSYALFTDEILIGNHLQAGTLNITLTRNSLDSYLVGDDGYLHNNFNNEIIDFTEKTDRNIFDINNDTLVVPCSYCEATMEIKNNSTVTFAYWIDIIIDGENSSSERNLAKQLQVDVTTYDENNNEVIKSSTINDGLTIGNKNQPVGILSTSSAETFKVKVSFIDNDSINNDAKKEKACFDLCVYAVQVIENTSN